jgi:hypothetical protein
MSFPFPNAYAHPLPKFTYHPESGQISINFECDPSFPTVSNGAWKNKTHLLVNVPMRKPKSIIDNATEFLSSAITTPLSFLSGQPATTKSAPEEVFNGQIDLGEDEVLEEDRGEEAEVDDSQELLRRVIMIAVSKKAEDENAMSPKAINRRRWQVVPLRTTDKRTGM